MELRSELCLWVETTLTPGSEFLMDHISLWSIWTRMKTEIPEDQLEEHALKLSAKDFACWSKAKATTKKRTCWLFIKNRSHGKKKLDRHWTREIFSLRKRSIEESDPSSSFTESTSRRRWSISGGLLLLHQKIRGKSDTKVKLLWAHKLSSTKEWSDLMKTLAHQAIRNGMLIRLGLLKSGNLMNWWK